MLNSQENSETYLNIMMIPTNQEYLQDTNDFTKEIYETVKIKAFKKEIIHDFETYADHLIFAVRGKQEIPCLELYLHRKKSFFSDFKLRNGHN